MATRINIRGMIVGSEYDSDWAAKYIERGVITPESHFRRQLAAAAEAGEEVEIYICSQGGDVTAGGEMANAIREFAGAKSITLGAFAASMAANIALTAGCPVRAHRNTVLLYHGAWSIVIGGSGAMEDEARILDLINEPIKTALVDHGVPRATVERGFSEGRAFTMGAREALAYGIVSEILDDDGEEPEKLTQEETEALQAQAAALPVAAAAAWQGADIALAADPHAALFDAEDRAARALADLDAMRAERDRLAGEEAALRTERDTLASTLADARQATARETARANALAADLDRARAAHAALTGRVLAPSDDAPATWLAAVAKYGTDRALALFPALAADYRARHSTKQSTPNHK